MSVKPDFTQPTKIGHMHGDIHVHEYHPIPYMRGDGKRTFDRKEADDPKYGPQKIKPLGTPKKVDIASPVQLAGRAKNAKLGNGAKVTK